MADEDETLFPALVQTLPSPGLIHVLGTAFLKAAKGHVRPMPPVFPVTQLSPITPSASN